MSENVPTHLHYICECKRDTTSMPNRPEYPRPVCFCGKDTMVVAGLSDATYVYPDDLPSAATPPPGMKGDA